MDMSKGSWYSGGILIDTLILHEDKGSGGELNSEFRDNEIQVHCMEIRRGIKKKGGKSLVPKYRINSYLCTRTAPSPGRPISLSILNRGLERLDRSDETNKFSFYRTLR